MLTINWSLHLPRCSGFLSDPLLWVCSSYLIRMSTHGHSGKRKVGNGDLGVVSALRRGIGICSRLYAVQKYLIVALLRLPCTTVILPSSTPASSNLTVRFERNGSRTQDPRSLRRTSKTRFSREESTSNRQAIHKAATAVNSKVDCNSVDIMYQFWVSLVFECDQCHEEYTQEGTFLSNSIFEERKLTFF
jgi:hypothetical protein